MRILLFLIWIHFIADFIFQTNNMALNKSKYVSWLSYHCIEYGFFLIPLGLKYAGINMVLHFITDFISSKLTTYFWKREKRKAFFIVIGADQAIHMTCLILTMRFIDESFISWLI